MNLTTSTLAVLSSLLGLSAGADVGRAQAPAAQTGVTAEEASVDDEDDAHPFSGTLATPNHCIVTDHIRLFAGYTFMYWTNVVQPGQVIDQSLNSRQIPTSGLAGPLTVPARPTPIFRNTDFWAQGLNVGAMAQY